ncbi:hypothetical protein [Halalkalicoccus jeotgali]|uniref:hypothetical protein n=1 Tax=Halalkalicoccus jeotgali TaxID=413810 RepID=UPI00138AB1D0|nr:hypothetical protein [Halalkalicoccus jeotgali]
MNRQTDDKNETIKQSSMTMETTDETVSGALERVYQKRLLETLQRAVRNHSDGVDIVHLELHQQSNNCGLNVWQATEWDTEPPDRVENHCQRYDFRYYDREVLSDCLSCGVWPGNNAAGNFFYPP